MKRIIFAPAALASFDDIIAYTLGQFGAAQADTYTNQIVARLEALAEGRGPQARPCELLMQGIRETSGLGYYREGSHFLILRQRIDILEVVEILHGKMDIETHLQRLIESSSQYP